MCLYTYCARFTFSPAQVWDGDGKVVRLFPLSGCCDGFFCPAVVTTALQDAIQRGVVCVLLLVLCLSFQLPQKSIDYIKDVSAVVGSVTIDDVQELYESLGVRNEDIWEGIGISGPVPPPEFGRKPTKVSVSSKLRNSTEE